MCHRGCKAKSTKKPTSCPANARAEGNPMLDGQCSALEDHGWGVAYDGSELSERYGRAGHAMLVVIGRSIS